MARRSEFIRHMAAGRFGEAKQVDRAIRRGSSHADKPTALEIPSSQLVAETSLAPVQPETKPRSAIITEWQAQAKEDWERYLMDGAENGSLDIPDDALAALVPSALLDRAADPDAVRVYALDRDRDNLYFVITEPWPDQVQSRERIWNNQDISVLGNVQNLRPIIQKQLTELMKLVRLLGAAKLGTYSGVARFGGRVILKKYVVVTQYKDQSQQSSEFLRRLKILQGVKFDHALIDYRDSETTEAVLALQGQVVSSLPEADRQKLGLPAIGLGSRDCYLDLNKLKNPGN